jgi:LysR family transcriptional activator of nhaA
MFDGQPFLLPGTEVALYARLARWFEAERLRPRIIGEFDDSALLMAFGQAGAGYFAAPTAIESYIAKQYEVKIVGRIDTVREQIYAITNERTLTHPIISDICRFAQHDIFGDVGRAKYNKESQSS